MHTSTDTTDPRKRLGHERLRLIIAIGNILRADSCVDALFSLDTREERDAVRELLNWLSDDADTLVDRIWDIQQVIEAAFPEDYAAERERAAALEQECNERIAAWKAAA
jgi:hypothetical protein